MKKILVVVFMFVFSLPLCPACAAEIYETSTVTKEGKYQKLITEIGFKILNENQIDKRVVFRYQTLRIINAFATPKDKTVEVYKGILPQCDSEDELAAVIAHEIAHQLDFYKGYGHTFAMQFVPRKYEYKADKVGVDLMAKAGYNPLAMIVVFNKMMGQISPIRELFSTHPITSKRLMEIYEYVYVKYPDYLVKNTYKDNIYYQNFLLTSAENRKKLENSLKNPNSFVNVRYK